MTKELDAQWKNAFDFVQKFCFEVSYLIKEVEGLLSQEDEKFVICRSSGYGATMFTSTGLEAVNVENWFPHTVTAAFVPGDQTQLQKGQTITPYHGKLRPLVLHIEVFSQDLACPLAYPGCLWSIAVKTEHLKKKFESLLWEFAYNPGKILSKVPDIAYEDSDCSFKGKMSKVPLFSINNSEDVASKLVSPMLKLCRG